MKNQTVRIRAMVAENNEVWYAGDNLTVVLHKNTEKSPDSPPYLPVKVCNLCSEARYEVSGRLYLEGHFDSLFIQLSLSVF